MAKRILQKPRRDVLAGLGAAALAASLPRVATAQAPQSLALQAKPRTIALRPGQAETPVWSLERQPPLPRLKRGQLEIGMRNQLPVSAALDWRGLDGALDAEPLTARVPLAAGAQTSFAIALRDAGTSFCDLWLLGDGEARPARPLPIVVEEDKAPEIDRDELFLLENWRIRADGTVVAPGTAANDTQSLYTVNGRVLTDISMRQHQRLRLRFINGVQRQIVAVKIDDHDVWVMALDGQPSEPFLARNGALVLAPGGRADVFVDASAAPGSSAQILLHDGQQSRPIGRLITSNEPAMRQSPLPPAAMLPTNGLPAELNLKNALRFELPLNGPEWVAPTHFVVSATPAFQAKAGRIVVLALSNRASIASVFHLHGHHFRLLDRLDDGWKPFWLDTLAVEPGQTQRIAFAAEHAGHWLLESTATDWAAPRLVRWYGVG
ncbi:MAG: multicopper oxidase domain-containing protein [Bradyrhizobium sp.]